MKFASRTTMDLRQAIADTMRQMKHHSTLRHRGKWQAVDARPEHAAYELVGHTLTATLGSRDLDYYRKVIVPDLPWCRDHFAERVSGEPLNPPPSEAWWPHAATNAQHKHSEIFSHTYPERLWPKRAGSGGVTIDTPLGKFKAPPSPMQGIRYPYGDLQDVVNLLAEDPYTRQAYCPIWYPEDTGNLSKVRKPCTLGYHFQLTDDKLDIFYPIRSCDIKRHFRNDVYLAVRLLLWILDQLEKRDEKWSRVVPGVLRMYIFNLHIFINDFAGLFPDVNITHRVINAQQT